MRISDWSSDVCSSDLKHEARCLKRTLKIFPVGQVFARKAVQASPRASYPACQIYDAYVDVQFLGIQNARKITLATGPVAIVDSRRGGDGRQRLFIAFDQPACMQIGRAAGRERGCQYV